METQDETQVGDQKYCPVLSITICLICIFVGTISIVIISRASSTTTVTSRARATIDRCVSI